MNYIKFKWVMLSIAFSLISITMNAQEKSALNAQEKSLAGISATTATGKTNVLKIQLNEGLDNGLTVNEIKEALTQLYAYCGFPRSLNAINAFSEVLKDRQAKGLKDKEGKAIAQNSNPNKYEQGRKTLEELTKTPQAKPAPGFGEFAPRIDAFLKEHLFADIFASDVLSYRQRELVTIAALASMEGVESQLKSHLAMGKNTGITDAELKDLSSIIHQLIGATQANILLTNISEPSIQVIKPDMMVRVSEIEIVPEHLEAYKEILKEEAAASVKLEPGVLAIFPMWQMENKLQVRIVEIYADKEAYQKHLQTSHFQHYKTSTLPMVKSLKLVDMKALDEATMQVIFKKIK